MASDQISQYFGMLYSIASPVLGVVGVAFLLLPKLLESSAKPQETARAYFCYLMEVVGVFLMSLSALQTLSNVVDSSFLSGKAYSAQEYLAMLIMFSAGGFLFLWCDQQIQEIAEDAKRVPGLIYFYFMKSIGHLAIVLSALALAWTIALGIERFPGWWVVPIVLLGYGSLLSWLTASEAYNIPLLGDFINMKPVHKGKPTGKSPKMVKRTLRPRAV